MEDWRNFLKPIAEPNNTVMNYFRHSSETALYEMITSFGVVCNSHLRLNSRSFSRENKTQGGYPKMDYHPVQGGVEILLAASRYGSGSQWLSGSLQGFKRLLFFS